MTQARHGSIRYTTDDDGSLRAVNVRHCAVAWERSDGVTTLEIADGCHVITI